VLITKRGRRKQMADVKWIKITTDMFDNRKIKHLRRLPEGNNIVLIWVMLLTMAGRCNSGGMIFLTENIPYTAKMLADELEFEESTVVLALEVLSKLNMVVTDSGYFAIAGWEEYQNIEGMDKIREQTRKRVAKHRESQRLLGCNVTSNVTVTQSNATDKDIDIELEKDIDIDICDSVESKPAKPIKHKYGEYKNVLLTDEELDKLKAEYPDYMDRIERVSSYVASTGKSYKSHYATIRNWAKKDTEKKPQSKPVNKFNNFTQRQYDNEFFEKIMRRKEANAVASIERAN
jgi:predicted phage replisome organizer